MKWLLLISGVILGLLLIALVRTLLMPGKKAEYTPQESEEESLRLAQKLSKMVQYDTTSHAGMPEPEKFRGFHKTLEELFPLVFSRLEKTDLDGNLLFYWKGKHSDKPILLMSHQDVVPAEGAWEHPPFSGDIADGKVYGRGTGDTKCSVMAFFEAVEQLLEQGVTPEQDVYLASSCTEEVGGDGAPKLVAELQRRGVELYLICDEGGGIIREPIAGIPGNFAMVGATPAPPERIRPLSGWRASSRRWSTTVPSGRRSCRRWRRCLQGLHPMPPSASNICSAICGCFGPC